MGLAARRSVEGRSWASVNAALPDHYGEVVAARKAAGDSALSAVG